MSFKKTLTYGFSLWVLIAALEVGLVYFLSEMVAWHYVVRIVGTIILTTIVAWLYFKENKTQLPDAFILSLWWLIIIVVLDVFVKSRVLYEPAGQSVGDVYMHSEAWVKMALIVAVVTLTSKIKK